MAAGIRGKQELVHNGFRIGVWVEGDLAVIDARPLHSPDADSTRRPALPSRARLLIWAGSHGTIRDRLRQRTRRARFSAWLLRRPCPSPEEQIERLTDELIAAIQLYELSDEDAWLAPGEGGQAQRPSDLESFERYQEVSPDGGPPGSKILVTGGIAIIGALTAVMLLAPGLGDDADASPTDAAPSITTDMPEPASVPSEDKDEDADILDLASRIATAPPAPLQAPAYVFDGGEEPDLRQLSGDAHDAAGQYVVQAGDSLLRIADRLEVDLDALVAANTLTDGGTIVPGQVLRLP